MENLEYKVAAEVAIADVKKYVDSITDKDIELDQVRDTYPKLVKAVMLGLVTLQEDVPPVYTLKEPIKNPAGDITITELNFKERITVSTLKSLGKGLDMKKDSIEFGIKVMAHIVDQPTAILDKLGRFDYKLIEEVTPLFS